MPWWKREQQRAPEAGSLQAQVKQLRDEVDALNLMVGFPQVSLTVSPDAPPVTGPGWMQVALGLATGTFEVRNVGFSAVYNIELSPIVTVARPNPQGKDFELRQVERGETADPAVDSVVLEIVDAKPTRLRLEFRSIPALASKEEKCMMATVDGVGSLQRHDVVTALLRASSGMKIENVYPVTLKATNIRGDRIESEYEIVFRPWAQSLSCRFKDSRIIPAGKAHPVEPEPRLSEGKIAAEAASVRLSQEQVKEGVGVWISERKS
jgi:hypothetical protein